MLLGQIIDYYNQCYIDYQAAWRLDQTFSMHAGFYDDLHKTHNSALTNMNRIIAESTEIKAGETVLDAGCGIGGSSVWLARVKKAKVVGISINKKQIDTATRLAKDNDVQTLTQFVIADFNNSQLPNNFFDVVWCLESVCHAPDKKMFLREMQRILRPGGRLVMADGFLTRASYTEAELFILNNWFEGWAIANLATPEDFAGWLDETGFSDFQFQNITKNVMPSSKRLCRLGLSTLPLCKIMEWRGIRSSVQTKNVWAAYYQFIGLKRGLWQYGILHACRK